MYALMETYFDRVTPTTFARDLAEKEWVILLRDTKTSSVCGFSTMMRVRAVANGELVTGLFSGDTIVDRDYWSESVLARVWSQHAFTVAASIRDSRTYWFLICSGYKTYRFLPVFFREFYPTFECETPPRATALMRALASSKYPHEYDAARGVVRPRRPAPLGEGVADVTPQRIRDPHVAFFVASNPGHVEGDELVQSQGRLVE
jgi:hypothetical protein